MRLLVFGASGPTGRLLVEQALAAGDAVTAFLRPTSVFEPRHERLALHRGDALHPAAVEEAVGGHDAVLSALGVSRGAPINVCSEGTRNIVEAMRRRGVRRLVCLSAFGAGETRRGGPYAAGIRALIPARMRDKERMEELVRGSGLEWVIVRPPILTHGPLTRRYRSGVGMRLGWFPTVSRADVADFMLAQARSDEHLRRAVTVSY